MEAIAMRMTQEEFDSIKDFLPYININNLKFNLYPYLTNAYISEDIFEIGTLIKNMLEYQKVYEYFDKDIFLKACDVEVENVWKGSEIQFRDPKNDDDWFDYKGSYEFRLKPQPDYSKEIESLQ